MDHLAVVLSRPDVSPIAHLNELGADPHSVCFAPDATLQHIVNVKFTADLVQWRLTVFVVHHRSARDHRQSLRLEISQSADHLFRQAVTEVLLPGITGQVLEGQYRQSQSSAGGPGPGARALEIDRQARDQNQREAKEDRPSPGQRLCAGFFDFRLSALLRTGRVSDEKRGARNVGGIALREGRDEAVALSRDGLDDTRLFRVVLQGLSKLSDCSVDAVVDIKVDVLAPDLPGDLFPGDELSVLFGQQQQHFHRDALQPDRPARTAQLVGTGVELEITAKSDCSAGSRWLICHRDSFAAGGETVLGFAIPAQKQCFQIVTPT